MKRYILKLKAWWIGRKKRNPHIIIEKKVEESRLPLSNNEMKKYIKEKILNFSLKLYTIISPSDEESVYLNVVCQEPMMYIYEEPKRV